VHLLGLRRQSHGNALSDTHMADARQLRPHLSIIRFIEAILVMLHSWCGRVGGIDGLQGDAIKEYQVHPPTFTFILQYFLGVRSVVVAMQGSTQSHLKLLLSWNTTVLQVALAAEFKRPISLHCVKGYGHLLTYFTTLGKTPDSCPPRVMLHSYGGSVEEIPRFCKIPNIGPRFYFSFSHAINHRTPEKLRARVAAVPDDRLLLESDQVG
jgi:hypothetical protein